MTSPKYQISMRDLEQRGGIHKLSRDGHSKEAIHKALYKHTDGAHHQVREKIISSLYDRQTGEK
jgi:hypothetical protein